MWDCSQLHLYALRFDLCTQEIKTPETCVCASTLVYGTCTMLLKISCSKLFRLLKNIIPAKILCIHHIYLVYIHTVQQQTLIRVAGITYFVCVEFLGNGVCCNRRCECEVYRGSVPNPLNATYHQSGVPGQPGNCECPPESVVCCREVCTWDVTQTRK